jgi:hypothetical protein
MVLPTCHFADPRTNPDAGYLEYAPPPEIRALAKKPNYNLEKNRREQDRKKKKEEKRLRKLENSRNDSAEPAADEPQDDAGQTPE